MQNTTTISRVHRTTDLTLTPHDDY